MVEFIGLLGIEGRIPEVMKRIRGYDGIKEVQGAFGIGYQDLDGAYVRGEAPDNKGLSQLALRIEQTPGIASATIYVLMDRDVMAGVQ